MNPSSPFNPRILHVEDLAVHRRMLPLRLGPMGKEVVSVGNAREALERLATARFDLILLDVIMPGMDGFELCRVLKQDPAHAGTTVLMLTDLRSDAFDRCMEAGADDYLPKQVQDTLLRIRVRMHLTLQALRRAKGGQAGAPGPSQIVLASLSNALRATLPAQFALEGHQTRLVGQLDERVGVLQPGDALLVLDTSLDPEGVHEFLASFRAQPEFAALPMLLLCEKAELPMLSLVETMVDDVMWKPLNARITRFRLRYLLELGRLG